MKVIIKAIYMAPNLRSRFKLPAHRGKRVITRGSVSWSKLLDLLSGAFIQSSRVTNYETDDFHGIRAIPVFRQEQAFNSYIQSFKVEPRIVTANELIMAIEEVTSIHLKEITSHPEYQSAYFAGQLLSHFADSSVYLSTEMFNTLAEEANELFAKIFRRKLFYRASNIKGSIVEIDDGRRKGGNQEAQELAGKLLNRIKSIEANFPQKKR